MDHSNLPTPTEAGNMSAADGVVAKILSLIDSGTITPGHTLPPERELSHQFNVSRTTLREAVHELILKGVLHRKQGSGTVVSATKNPVAHLLSDLPKNERTRQEMVDLRLVFEPAIAGFAALRRTESDLLYMETLCSDDVVLADPQTSLNADQQFHAAVARSTQNQLIVSMSTVVSSWISEYRARTHDTAEGRKLSQQGHKAILQAIKAKDDLKASELMYQHITDV